MGQIANRMLLELLQKAKNQLKNRSEDHSAQKAGKLKKSKKSAPAP